MFRTANAGPLHFRVKTYIEQNNQQSYDDVAAAPNNDFYFVG